MTPQTPCGLAWMWSCVSRCPISGEVVAGRTCCFSPVFSSRACQLGTGHGNDGRFNVERRGDESGLGLRAGGTRKEGEQVVGSKGTEGGAVGRGWTPPPPTSSPAPALLAPEGSGGCIVCQGDLLGAIAFFPIPHPRNITQHSVGNAKQEKNETRFSRSRRELFTWRPEQGSHSKGQAGWGQSRPFWVLQVERPRG